VQSRHAGSAGCGPGGRRLVASGFGCVKPDALARAAPQFGWSFFFDAPPDNAASKGGWCVGIAGGNAGRASPCRWWLRRDAVPASVHHRLAVLESRFPWARRPADQWIPHQGRATATRCCAPRELRRISASFRCDISTRSSAFCTRFFRSLEACRDSVAASSHVFVNREVANQVEGLENEPGSRGWMRRPARRASAFSPACLSERSGLSVGVSSQPESTVASIYRQPDGPAIEIVLSGQDSRWMPSAHASPSRRCRTPWSRLPTGSAVAVRCIHVAPFNSGGCDRRHPVRHVGQDHLVADANPSSISMCLRAAAQLHWLRVAPLPSASSFEQRTWLLGCRRSGAE